MWILFGQPLEKIGQLLFQHQVPLIGDDITATTYGGSKDTTGLYLYIERFKFSNLPKLCHRRSVFSPVSTRAGCVPVWQERRVWPRTTVARLPQRQTTSKVTRQRHWETPTATFSFDVRLNFLPPISEKGKSFFVHF